MVIGAVRMGDEGSGSKEYGTGFVANGGKERAGRGEK